MTKTTIFKTVSGAAILSCFLLLGLQAAPQYRDDDAWHQDRDAYYHGQGWHARFFERIRQDLDHVQALAFSGADEDRVVETKRQLDELQSKEAAGEYDQPELDTCIAALRRVVADNRLAARDRDMLSDDLNRMRDYREHHDNWR